MLKRHIVRIPASGRKMKLIVLSPQENRGLVPGILWIHGGGYVTGMAAMVYASCGKDLAERFGAVVISPEYRLAGKAPYPAALNDCYAALSYMWDHAEDLGIDRDRIMVGGESAGGGLAAAVCIYARDQKKIRIAMQMPLYPMLDCRDTASSRDNHGKVWNTKRNHRAWRRYLGPLYGAAEVPAYASPARETDYRQLPPCYTYVCDGEPFLDETLCYVKNLSEAGVSAKINIFPGDFHGFDLFFFWKNSVKEAKKKRAKAFETIIVNGQSTFPKD